MKLEFEKYKLDNGLEVVLHQDFSAPVVSVAIQYHVGSNREELGKTGYAHLFEHMLFQASEHLERNAFFNKIEELGGSFNGGTWTDGTIYYETVPMDALEKVLWMESDRMGFFINTVSESGLRREQDIVINEKRQIQDNRAYGFTTNVINENLFPLGHPYSWTVIGQMADLKNAHVDDIKNFYNKYYCPNNACLVIAGDFDVEQTKAMVEKYFGEIQAKAEVKPLQVQQPVLTANKKFYHEDQFAQLPELTIVYPTVDMKHPDSYPLAVLAEMLSEGKKAPLYNVIVEDKQLASFADMSNNPMELAGYATITVRAYAGKNLNDVFDAVQESFAKFERDGVDEKVLQGIKNSYKTSLYASLQGSGNKAINMAQYNVLMGSPDYMITEAEMISNVTSEDIMRVYNKYIKDCSYLATSFVPMGSIDLALNGSEKANVVIEDTSKQDFESDGVTIVDEPYEMTPSKIDRSVEPQLHGKWVLSTPDIWTDNLSNGIKMYGMYQNKLPLVYFSLNINGGMLFNPKDKLGLSVLTARVMNEGSQFKTPEEMEEAINLLGARLNITPSNEYTNIGGYCLSENFEPLMQLLNEKLLYPRWDEKEFERIKQSTINSIHEEMVSLESISNRVFPKLIYSNESILSESARGTIASVSALTIDDLKTYYDNYFSPNLSSFYVVGDIEPQKAKSIMEDVIGSWSHEDVASPQPILDSPQLAGRLFFVDQPEASQSYIKVGKRSMSRASEDYYPATIANFRLGDGTSSLLFSILRLQKGYTYGAYSGFNANEYLNTFNATSSVQGSVTAESLILFKDIIKGYKDSFTEEDLVATKDAMVRSKAGAYETYSSLLNLLTSIGRYNLPFDHVTRNTEYAKSLTLDQAKDLIAKYLPEEEMVYLVVGDAKSQLKNLEKCGLGKPILLDKEGNIVE